MPLFGKTDAKASLPKYLELGRLLAINVLTGGTGYTNGATAVVTITGGGGTGATATALVTGGIVQSVTITAQGLGYTSTPTLSIPGASNATFLVKLESNFTNAQGLTPIFVDDTEAALLTTKSKGIHSPGWWLYQERKDSNGDTRYRAELLVSMTSVTTGTGDLEENLIAPNVESVVSITTQPANQSSSAGAATFTVVAAITGGGALAYQWQVAAAGAPTKFTNIASANSASYAASGRVLANNGDKYRCAVSGGGAKTVNTAAATLTFVS